MVMTSLQAELFTDYSDHPRKLVTLNPKLKSQAPDAISFFPLVEAYRKRYLKDLSPKSQTLWHCSRLAERGALPMIDRGDIRQAIDRCSNTGFTAGRWLYCLEQGPDSLIANSVKRAERSERLMYEQSHRDYLRLVICIIVCLSWAVNHYRDNAITYKAQRDKNARELKLANAANY